MEPQAPATFVRLFEQLGAIPYRPGTPDYQPPSGPGLVIIGRDLPGRTWAPVDVLDARDDVLGAARIALADYRTRDHASWFAYVIEMVNPAHRHHLAIALRSTLDEET